jgi:hypothetical protein
MVLTLCQSPWLCMTSIPFCQFEEGCDSVMGEMTKMVQYLNSLPQLTTPSSSTCTSPIAWENQLLTPTRDYHGCIQMHPDKYPWIIHIIHKNDKWTFAKRMLQYALLMCNYWYTTNSYVFDVPITEKKANLVFQYIFGYYQEKLDVTDWIGHVEIWVGAYKTCVLEYIIYCWDVFIYSLKIA